MLIVEITVSVWLVSYLLVPVEHWLTQTEDINE